TPELFEFEYESFQVLAPSQLSIVTPEPTDFLDPDEVVTYTYSGSGDVEAALVAIDVDGADSGCEPDDFTEPLDGAIAVIKRGTCPFFDKATNAVAAGASAVIIFNDGATPERLGPVAGTSGEPVDVPVVGPSNAAGLALVDAARAGGTARVEAALFGGDAGVAYDPCDHDVSDTRDNVNRRALRQMSNAAAHVTGMFADSTLTVNGVFRQTTESGSSATEAIQFDRVGDLWLR
ncbi:MAG: PA domain-containing protein, partial [Ilumatobacter sp.]|uniref:PA domain-containing protein n=1 Tax=Ilumatobacter sp. TaxID=1967498 RepID=UPI003C74782A